MSKTPQYKPIIPLGFKVRSDEDREKLRGLIKRELEKFPPKQIKVFALRNALRMAWFVARLAIKDKDKVDRFYGVWLRSLVAASVNGVIESQAATPTPPTPPPTPTPTSPPTPPTPPPTPMSFYNRSTMIYISLNREKPCLTSLYGSTKMTLTSPLDCNF